MINPYSLLDSLVEILQSIPDLVEPIGGKERIVGHRDAYPAATTNEAIYQMETPGILVIWDGSGPTQSGKRDLWAHQFRVIFRAPTELSDAPGGYGFLWTQFINGVPTGQGQPFYQCRIHGDCYEVGTPSIGRAFLLVDPDSNVGIEYFESRFSLTERG